MSKTNGDTGSIRIPRILVMLDNNEYPTLNQLAEEFNVSTRTVYRDIKSIPLPISKNAQHQYYFENGFSLSSMSFSNLEQLLLFLSMDIMSEINPVFVKTSHALMSKLNMPGNKKPYEVKLDPYQEISFESNTFLLIENSINSKKNLKFNYQNFRKEVIPFKVMSLDEIWYLFAKDTVDHKFKTFFITDMMNIILSSHLSPVETHAEEFMEEIQSPYFEDHEKYEIIVKVLQPIAHYFLRKKHLLSQELISEDEYGDLLIKFNVTSDEEVDNLIKSWLPHVQIVSPKRLQDKLIKELSEYIDNNITIE
jgi:predicted DNA-binding transcriptional regulator YafY